MRKFLLLFLSVIAVFSVSAKLTRFAVRAYIDEQDFSKTEWQRPGVDSVYVALVQNDTVLVPFRILSGNDTIKMTHADMRLLVEGGVGDYTLILNREGFEPLRRDFRIASEGQDVIYLRGVSMQREKSKTLKEVEIVGTAVKVVMKGDTIIYDSAAFQLPEGSTLDALIRQLPGAELDADGAITVNGKKVQSLLLNGNDFFKSDPDVMLKNLPSYVVDKIKVYDKAGKNDNVSLSSHRLSDSPQDENLVMDVTLKKEFAMATIFNVEGGYGPGIYRSEDPRRFDNRYLGRAFVIGFGKTYRFSVFGTANNINNTAKATSSNKDWGNGWGQTGELSIAMGGMDLNYKPNDKIETQAEFQYSREQIDLKRLTSTTQFYETGNLYSRSRLEQSDLRHHIIASAGIEYQGDNFYFTARPHLDWFRSTGTEFSYNANFSTNPAETSRGTALDSLFALAGAEPSADLRESVTSTNYQSYRGQAPGEPDWDDWSINVYGQWRPPKMRGYFSFDGSAKDRKTLQRYGRLYYQTLADKQLDPTRRTQWTDQRNRNTEALALLSYSWDKRFMNDVVSNNVDISGILGWSLERQFADKALFSDALMQGFDPRERILPSQIAAANARVDAQNTINSLFLNNRAQAELNVSYSREYIAPTDSGFNPRLSIWTRFSHRQHFRHLSYHKAFLAPEFSYVTNTCDPTEEAYLGIFLSSSNKKRYGSLSLSYSYYNSLINLFSLIPSTNTSDPLNVYLGPEKGANFLRPTNHYMRLYFYGYGLKNHINMYASVSSTIHRNSMAQTAVFDPASGITTHRPISVNGNWQLNANYHISVPFGPRECWNVTPSIHYTHDNSVDYTSASGAPLRSVVRNDILGGNLSISFKLKNGTRFALTGGSSWQHSMSPRPDFQTISATGSYLGANIDFYLPWSLEGSTSLRANFRRGYQDVSLNTTEWIWNASVQKSILNGALTFKIDAVDLLGQLSNVSYLVNAQGRTETWTNNLPRYAMLTISYRFTFTPAALK